MLSPPVVEPFDPQTELMGSVLCGCVWHCASDLLVAVLVGCTRMAVSAPVWCRWLLVGLPDLIKWPGELIHSVLLAVVPLPRLPSTLSGVAIGHHVGGSVELFGTHRELCATPTPLCPGRARS
jgi:hypothetical protein